MLVCDYRQDREKRAKQISAGNRFGGLVFLAPGAVVRSQSHGDQDYPGAARGKHGVSELGSLGNARPGRRRSERTEKAGAAKCLTGCTVLSTSWGTIWGGP